MLNRNCKLNPIRQAYGIANIHTLNLSRTQKCFKAVISYYLYSYIDLYIYITTFYISTVYIQ